MNRRRSVSTWCRCPREARRQAAVLALVALVPLALAMPEAAAQDGLARDILPDWNLSVTNTARLEYYGADGNTAASPYFARGPKFYDESFVEFSRQFSPYRQLTGYAELLGNSSPYRSSDEGFFPERLNLTWQDGEASVPNRVEIGDYFGYFSLRTLQRALKGVQVDLQPIGTFLGARHSIIGLSGYLDQNYNAPDANNDLFNGISWLIEHPTWGTFALNAVHNYRDANRATGLPHGNQGVFSLAGSREFVFDTEHVSVEGELGRSVGDYDLGIAGSQHNHAGTGAFASIRGYSDAAPLFYSFRFENYDKDYRPNGAVITPDRKAYELRGGWRFDNGLRLEGRLQDNRDAVLGLGRLHSQTAGLTLTGPMLDSIVAGTQGRLDAFIESQQLAGAIHQTLGSISADLTFPAVDKWQPRAFVNLLQVDDDGANARFTTAQFNLSADHPIDVLGFSGAITPGMVLRSINGGGRADIDVGPSVSFYLDRDGHRLTASYSYLAQRRSVVGTPNVDNHVAGLTYNYTIGSHTFGIEADYVDLAPSPGQDTESYRAAVFWREALNRPAVPRRPTTPSAPAPVPATGPLTLADLPPGMLLGPAERLVEDKGGGHRLETADVVVYEIPVLRGVIERQRLVLQHSGGRLSKSALIVSMESARTGGEAADSFEQVRQQLLRRYGAPIRAIETGSFSASYVDDINDGRLVRLVEWRLAKGILRIGMPRRLDRQVRIEVQYAASFPPPSDLRWSLEQVH